MLDVVSDHFPSIPTTLGAAGASKMAKNCQFLTIFLQFSLKIGHLWTPGGPSVVGID